MCTGSTTVWWLGTVFVCVYPLWSNHNISVSRWILFPCTQNSGKSHIQSPEWWWSPGVFLLCATRCRCPTESTEGHLTLLIVFDPKGPMVIDWWGDKRGRGPVWFLFSVWTVQTVSSLCTNEDKWNVSAAQTGRAMDSSPKHSWESTSMLSEDDIILSSMKSRHLHLLMTALCRHVWLGSQRRN